MFRCIERKRESEFTCVDSFHGSSPVTTTPPPSGRRNSTRLPVASASEATWKPTDFITAIARRPAWQAPDSRAAASASLLAICATTPISARCGAIASTVSKTPEIGDPG